MPSSRLCQGPLVTSSTRHVYKTTRRPPEDQSWRLQLDLKHEDVLKTSWCILQGYVIIKSNILNPPWWRLQHVMFIRPQEDHRRPVLMTFASGLEARICLEDVFMLSSWLCHYQMQYFRGPLVTSLTRHMFIRPQKDHRRPVLMAFASGLEAWRRLENVLMLSYGLWSN